MEERSAIVHLIDKRKPFLRWGMIALFVITTALIMPKYYRSTFVYESGRTWTGPDLLAEFDFAKLKNARLYEDDKQKALQSVYPVFAPNPGAVEKTLRKINNKLKQLNIAVDNFVTKRQLHNESDGYIDSMRTEILVIYGVDPEMASNVKREGSGGIEMSFMPSFNQKIKEAIVDLYKNNFIDSAQSDITSDRVVLLNSANEKRMIDSSEIIPISKIGRLLDRELAQFPSVAKELAKNLISGGINPGIIFDPVETRKERDLALSKISKIYGRIKQGEVIVAHGELISDDIDNSLQSYIKVTKEKFGNSPYWLTLVGQIALMTMITFMLVLYLRTNRPRIFYRNRKLAMVLLLYLLAVGFLVLAMKVKFNTAEEYKLIYAFLAPVCMVPIMLTAFFDGRFGFFGNIIIALVGGSIVPNGFEYFFVQMIGGTVSTYSLGKMRNRGSFFVSLFLILSAYSVAFIGYNFYLSSGFTTIHYGNLLLFIANIVLTFLTWLIIYVFEVVFGLTSDLTYVELLDTNHPLLKELFMKAPGTFQHSLQVANISEAVVNKIGGNSLKAKVGALFHDVGKIKNPQFFIENSKEGENPHEGLTPEESAHVIIQHVADGVKIAREHNLPAEVIDFIRTHHGTSRTEFFYRNYKEDHHGEVIPESSFHYPGPLPFTREMAVVMIADSVEAASRSLKDHSPDKIKDLVINMVESKVTQKQFINVNLTFRDVEDIKQVIFLQIATIFHERIEYPEEK